MMPPRVSPTSAYALPLTRTAARRLNVASTAVEAPR